MSSLNKINDFVVKFANVNGTGSASANFLFAKTIFRMGVPVCAKNIFPSNIQGLPTWYEVRVSEKGYLSRKEGINLMVAVNPQSFKEDVSQVVSGGYLLYDSTKTLHEEYMREDIHFIGVPFMDLCNREFTDARQRQLFKNIVYVGALAALIDLDTEIIEELFGDQFKGKERLIEPNMKALRLGYEFIINNYNYPLPFKVEKRNLTKGYMMIDGNSASALGALYGGATIATWYPITPSTSLVSAFEKYAKQLRHDPISGKNNFAVVQAEDELAAVGMAIGANWNGARAFTATSGAGVSLMMEFLGLAYYAEIPLVLVNVQRGGPSTGMPTRTQQSDITFCAYASHGDTKQILLFPADPKECFEMMADSFDFADVLQTPIIVMSDLDIGMNDHICEILEWDDNRKYKRGKVLTGEDLENMNSWGRYKDIDGDGIGYRTLPGTHPTKGSYFTRGSSHDEMARYSEDSDTYVRIVNRISQKFKTAKEILPQPEINIKDSIADTAIIYFGSSMHAAKEALDIMENDGLNLNSMRIRSFPFCNAVKDFINQHEKVFVIEQNKDAQMRSLLINELEINPSQLLKVLHFDGTPITAESIVQEVNTFIFQPNN